MDKIGPICRSAEDCGHVLAAMAGGDSKDPGSAGKDFYYSPQYARKITDLRIGWAPVDFTGWVEPGARPVFEKAVTVVRELGAEMRERDALPDFPYGPVTGTIISAEGASVFEKLIESGEVDQLADKKQIEGLRSGLEIQARDYLKAMRIRTLIQQAFRRIFAEVDVLMAPARYEPPGKVAEPFDAPKPKREEPRLAGFRSLIPAGNLAGLPALCLPCGFSDGLPVALQLVGPPFSELTLLAIGREFQNRTDWHRQRPSSS
jgi:aspartyl-tRNA(Asn)/glutamyl-tRNA(Gln) amidotransferase subunit A